MRLHSLLAVAFTATAFLPATASGEVTTADVRRGIELVVATPGGPPGVIATLHRGGHTKVLSAGRANVRTGRVPRAAYHMRIASVAKAFSGAVALGLVQEGVLGLDDTIAQRRPDLPAAWGAVTLRQLLQHTSGVPDYTQSAGFARQFGTAPREYVSPAKLISWVAKDPLVFRPGSRYAYSNTDNIVVALMAEAATGRTYETLLGERVLTPAALTETSLVPRRLGLPTPDLRGYDVEAGRAPQDITTALSASGAWASGGIVSTPLDLNVFIRAYVGGRFFGTAVTAAQRRFVAGRSSPPGPGTNGAGLAVFRYKTRCGTVYGHTGSFPGYTQFAAATTDGSRGVTVSANAALPVTGTALRRLRAAEETAVCAMRAGATG